MTRALDAGVSVLSYADPAATEELWGEGHYQKLIVPQQIFMLRRMMHRLEGAILHLCPLCSTALERHGHLGTRRVPVASGDYLEALWEAAAFGGICMVGHRCINRPELPDHTLHQLILTD